FLGGHPAMISGATGAMALLMVDLVKDYGLEYLLAATLLTGLLQVIWGVLGVSRLMDHVPRAVQLGFVNALAILLFSAQLKQFAIAAEPTFLEASSFGSINTSSNALMYAMVAAGLAIIYLLPYLTQRIPLIKAIPTPIVAVVALTAITVSTGMRLPTVGDMGDLPITLPVFRLPDVPFTLETFQVILPVALTLSAVGLLTSFLTASILDESVLDGMASADSDKANSDEASRDKASRVKDRDARGQGMANLVVGMLGGMAGCAMVGQSVSNTKYGGRQRLSTLSAGVFLLFFVLVLREWVSLIPTAALVAVMIMVSFNTFDWSSIRRIHRIPTHETAVMLVTVLTALMTRNLAVGVLVGMGVSAISVAQAE
ncbi:MAG: SulP family inorganic anion transporter, partial [Cyanobacteria bacterium J06632_3]